MLAIRNGGMCSPPCSASARRLDAAWLAAAKRSIKALSFGFLTVALIASATTRSTPLVKYAWMSKF